MKAHQRYKEPDWQAEVKRQESEILACPDCGSSENYEPKKAVGRDGTERHYRACKMCGFWQEADGSDAYRCWKTEHVCVRHVGTQHTCPFCNQVLRPKEPEGTVTHTCGKYLMPNETGYFCTTCAEWYGRESEVPWPLRGSE